MTLLSDKLTIIFVHGMASKPPEKRWLGLWRDAIVGNVTMADRTIGRCMADDPDLFASAYWADAIPNHLPDIPATVSADQRSLSVLMALRRKQGAGMHIPKEGWGAVQARRFGVAAIDALSESLRVAWELREAGIAELHGYHSDPTIAERVRQPLEDRLREAWDAGRRVVIMAHSLGTTVAYDALWRFTHRREPELIRYRDRVVDLFVTMGSPLGDPGMTDAMLCGAWLNQNGAEAVTQRRRAWPHNISRWHNYSALGDVVSHGLDMDALFFTPMKRDLGGYKADDFRDYRYLFNPYRAPGDHPNPHKDFGYLVQPKLASQLCRYIKLLD
jgi:hypothetical protein